MTRSQRALRVNRAANQATPLPLLLEPISKARQARPAITSEAAARQPLSGDDWRQDDFARSSRW